MGFGINEPPVLLPESPLRFWFHDPVRSRLAEWNPSSGRAHAYREGRNDRWEISVADGSRIRRQSPKETLYLHHIRELRLPHARGRDGWRSPRLLERYGADSFRWPRANGPVLQ